MLLLKKHFLYTRGKAALTLDGRAQWCAIPQPSDNCVIPGMSWMPMCSSRKTEAWKSGSLDSGPALPLGSWGTSSRSLNLFKLLLPGEGGGLNDPQVLFQLEAPFCCSIHILSP